MGSRPTQRGRDKERKQAGLGDGRGEEVGELAWTDARGGKGKRLGMGEEDQCWDREQEDEGSKREERKATVTDALQLFLVSDAPS